MRADRRVDAARAVQLLRADDFVVQRFAHAVQALEFIVADGEVGARQMVDGAERLRIVRRELREHRVARAQQFPRAGDIGDVGVDLARVDGEVGKAIDLRPLDLGVPIGALDQPDHDPPVGAAGEVDDPVDHERAALAIGLHHEAKAIPPGEIGIGGEAFEQVERQLQPVGLFGIDVEADVIALGHHRQRLHARQQLAHHPRRLRADVTGVERRQLDRDAGPVEDTAACRRLADRPHGVFVIAIITVGIRCRRRRFAQHVVAVAEAARLQRAGALQRLGDRLPGDELFAHHAHRHVDAATDHRLARACDQPGERGAQPAVVDAAGQLAGDDEAPGRGIDEQRAAVADVAAPVAARDLVADQRVARRGVGNTQQRLGEAHQRDALLARQRIFLHQTLDAGALVLGAQRGDERRRGRGGVAADRVGQRRGVEQRREALCLRPAIGGGDRGAQRRLRADGRREIGEGRAGHGRRSSLRSAHIDFRAGDPSEMRAGSRRTTRFSRAAQAKWTANHPRTRRSTRSTGAS